VNCCQADFGKTETLCLTNGHPSAYLGCLPSDAGRVMNGLITTASTAKLSIGHTNARLAFIVVGFVHALYDGYTDLVCVLFSVRQTEFNFGYGVLAIVRERRYCAMTGLQNPRPPR
jgi:hypothetical protein